MKLKGPLPSAQDPAIVAFSGLYEFDLHRTPYLFQIHYNIILPYTSDSYKRSLLISPMLATCPAHLKLLDDDDVI
jgi:hypothetical protein